MSQATAWEVLIGETVLVDVAPPVVYIGRLEATDNTFLTLREAHVHELNSSTTKALYAIETARNGLQPTRDCVYLKQDKVISISRLSDIFTFHEAGSPIA